MGRTMTDTASRGQGQVPPGTQHRCRAEAGGRDGSGQRCLPSPSFLLRQPSPAKALVLASLPTEDAQTAGCQAALLLGGGGRRGCTRGPCPLARPPIVALAR